MVVFLINIFLIGGYSDGKRNPYKTIAWLLIFIVFPIGGYILYSFFGRDLRREKVYKNLQNCHRCERILEANRKRVLGAVPDCPQLSTLIENTTALPMQYRNTAKVLTNSPYTFREIIKALKSPASHPYGILHNKGRQARQEDKGYPYRQGQRRGGGKNSV